MSTVKSAVAPAVPSAVPSAVQVDNEPQLGPYKAATGSTSTVKTVPTSGDPAAAPPAPRYAGAATMGGPAESGGAGAPTVPPQTTALFKRGPIDLHYQVPDQGRDPYAKVNNPPTRGRGQWFKAFANHVWNGRQNVDNAGWQQSSLQQRTSVMRPLLPPTGDGYSPESYTPHQLPQSARTQRFLPTIGSDPYGTGVLNRDTYGAGQTAGGIGGNTYTPTPGPPDTTSTAQAPASGGGMPTWG